MFPFYLDLTELAAAHWAGLGAMAAVALQTALSVLRVG